MNRNSALLWLPKIEAAGLPTPRTIIIPYSHHDCLPLFDGLPCPEMDRLAPLVQEAAASVGMPAFIRTDLSSAKHGGPRDYLWTGESGAGSLVRTIEDNEIKFWLQRYDPAAIMVREFLHLEHSFTAFRGLPIAREWRLFSDGSAVTHVQPYWPADSLSEQPGLPDNWRALLAEMHRRPADFPELETMAIEAARVQDGGSWSVDLCRTVDGQWYLTDMAVAEDSYRWSPEDFQLEGESA